MDGNPALPKEFQVRIDGNHAPAQAVLQRIAAHYKDEENKNREAEEQQQQQERQDGERIRMEEERVRIAEERERVRIAEERERGLLVAGAVPADPSSMSSANSQSGNDNDVAADNDNNVAVPAIDSKV